MEDQIMEMETPSPSLALDSQFYQMLASMKKKKATGFSWFSFISWPELAPRLALASLMLIAGFFTGYLLKPSASNQEVAGLNSQINELKEMMMLTLLEKESATERLKAVSLTQEMDRVSNTVTNALFQTLENDANINVRLAALEALKPYTRNDNVRKMLVQSISKQESPLVQVALADLMVTLQEKSSVKELEKLLDNANTPDEVKKRIEESIKIMI
jgi:hypothetical protein